MVETLRHRHPPVINITLVRRGRPAGSCSANLRFAPRLEEICHAETTHADGFARPADGLRPRRAGKPSNRNTGEPLKRHALVMNITLVRRGRLSAVGLPRRRKARPAGTCGANLRFAPRLVIKSPYSGGNSPC